MNAEPSARISGPDHLDDAKLHLLRACLALKAAASADPALLTRLGTRHANLTAELEELERVTPRDQHSRPPSP